MSEKRQGTVAIAIKRANKHKHFIKYALIGVTGVSIDMFMLYILN